MSRFFIFSSIFILNACANYQIPIEPQNHPACFDVEVSEVELSPLLKTGQSERGVYVHSGS